MIHCLLHTRRARVLGLLALLLLGTACDPLAQQTPTPAVLPTPPGTVVAPLPSPLATAAPTVPATLPAPLPSAVGTGVRRP